MVTVPVGRFWSFCFWAAVLGVMTLNPEATSMLSLFCDMLCVLAQLIISAVHPVAIMLRKRRVVGFIDSDLPLVPNLPTFCNPGEKMRKRKGEIEKPVWFLIHPSSFSLGEILHLPR